LVGQLVAAMAAWALPFQCLTEPETQTLKDVNGGLDKEIPSPVKPPQTAPMVLDISNSADPSTMEQSTIEHNIFVDHDNLQGMREKVKEAISKPHYNVFDYYHESGIWPRIAKSHIFENLTLTIISINALWMWIDTDNNSADSLLEADVVFQVAEHFFCVYFSFEWFVRFMSFRRKLDGLNDGWFIFDSALVIMMVAETWVMTSILLIMGGEGGGGLSNASILRLFRLLRLSRLARMLRSMPELMILIKGMVAAGRSVFFTLCLLLLLLYIFSIAFTQLTAGTTCGELYFKTIGDSMYTLLIVGTFLDNLGPVMNSIKEDHLVYMFIFLAFIALAALMVMNMLIGVLCEVVSGVATAEKEDMMISFVRGQLRKVVNEIDTNCDDSISEKEFDLIVKNKVAISALVECGVDPLILIDMKDHLFTADDPDDPDEESNEEEEKTFTFNEFLDLVLQLRGSNRATVKEMVDLRKYLGGLVHKLELRVAKRTSRLNSMACGDGDESPLSISPVPSARNLAVGVPPSPLGFPAANDQLSFVSAPAEFGSEGQQSGAYVAAAVSEQTIELIGFLTADLHELKCLLDLLTQQSHDRKWAQNNRPGAVATSAFYVEMQQRVMRLEHFLGLTMSGVQDLRAALPPLNNGTSGGQTREVKMLRAWMARFEANFLAKSVLELQDLSCSQKSPKSAKRNRHTSFDMTDDLLVQELDGDADLRDIAGIGNIHKSSQEDWLAWLLRAQSQIRDALAELRNIRQSPGSNRSSRISK